MTRHLTDLDEISQKVKNFHARNYLDEAINSYRAGAYRASLISTWIAVCVDIIEKVRELALTEDAAAVAIAARLDAIDPSNTTAMLAFEKQILDFACDDLELISNIEKMHLERLKADRNLCAHPTFSTDGTQFSPLAELSLSYIVQASNYLLIQTPVKGKVAIERLFDLIGEDSFPEDDEKAYKILSSPTNLGKVRESVARNLTIVLIKRLFQDEQGIVPELLGRIAASLGVLSRLFPDTHNGVIEGKLSEILEQATDKRLKRLLPYLVKRSETWARITDPVKVRVDGLIRAMETDELISYRVAIAASKIGEINSSFQDSIADLDNEHLSRILQATPSEVLKNKAIEFFINARSFDSAESRGTRIIVPHSEYFVEADLEALFEGAYANSNWNINQILNAGGIGYFFGQLYESTKPSINRHGDLWMNFWNRTVELEFEYPELREVMERDGLLEPEQDEDVDDIGDIPF